ELSSAQPMFEAVLRQPVGLLRSRSLRPPGCAGQQQHAADEQNETAHGRPSASDPEKVLGSSPSDVTRTPATRQRLLCSLAVRLRLAHHDLISPPPGTSANDGGRRGWRTHPMRIVLSAFGSLGDLHPYLAIALGLRDRGHEAVVATSEYYRHKI